MNKVTHTHSFNVRQKELGDRFYQNLCFFSECGRQHLIHSFLVLVHRPWLTFHHLWLSNLRLFHIYMPSHGMTTVPPNLNVVATIGKQSCTF